MNTQELKDYRTVLCDHFADYPFNYHLTFNFNRVITRDLAEDQLRFFTCSILRCLRGRNYYRTETGDTFSYIAFPEIGRSSLWLHFHATAFVDPLMAEIFEAEAEGTWKRIVPGGQLYIQRLPSKEDRRTVLWYGTKYMKDEGDFILSESMPRPFGGTVLTKDKE